VIESRHADRDRHRRRWTDAGIRHAERDLRYGDVCPKSKDACDDAGSENEDQRNSQYGTWILSDDWLRDGYIHLAFLHGFFQIVAHFFLLLREQELLKREKVHTNQLSLLAVCEHFS
jgi:hypothetical protein